MSQTIGPITVDPFNNFGINSFLSVENAAVNAAFTATPAFVAVPTNLVGLRSASLNTLYPNVGSMFLLDSSLYIKTDPSRWVAINASTWALG